MCQSWRKGNRNEETDDCSTLADSYGLGCASLDRRWWRQEMGFVRDGVPRTRPSGGDLSAAVQYSRNCGERLRPRLLLTHRMRGRVLISAPALRPRSRCPCHTHNM